MLGTDITVYLDPVMHTLGLHPESLDGLGDVATPIHNLLDCLVPEVVWIAYTKNIKYLLFASIVTLSGIFDTRGLPYSNLKYSFKNYLRNNTTR